MPSKDSLFMTCPAVVNMSVLCHWSRRNYDKIHTGTAAMWASPVWVLSVALLVPGSISCVAGAIWRREMLPVSLLFVCFGIWSVTVIMQEQYANVAEVLFSALFWLRMQVQSPCCSWVGPCQSADSPRKLPNFAMKEIFCQFTGCAHYNLEKSCTLLHATHKLPNISLPPYKHAMWAYFNCGRVC